MLKFRSEVKESLLLVVFSFLLREYLTVATILFVAFGALLVGFKKRPNKMTRNIIALMVFASYWWSYGKVIDPEVGLNFLTTVIVLKLLEKESERDGFMILFGLLLIISAGSLFEKNLSYVIFYTMSFLLLIYDFYLNRGIAWKLKDFSIALLWVLPLTFSLFFFAPRLVSPIPFQQGKPSPGEVGYTPDVNISMIESLASNDEKVFEAQVSRMISQDDLYWRGNTLSFTDGWNWTLMNKSYGHVSSTENVADELTVKQSIRVYGRQEYFFTLDHPLKIMFRSREVYLNDMRSLSQGRSDWVARYDVVSSPVESFSYVEEDEKKYLRLPLKRIDKQWILATFKSEKLEDLNQELREYFAKNGFSYSLSPGSIQSFNDFMKIRKIGFCSHYASALALILRVKKIPSRLVSGFMGGSYNPYAQFYSLSQNDAHVWVEALENKKWVRVDPTSWIAPDRIRLGGEGYMASVSQSNLNLNSLKQFAWLYQAGQWFSQWDFRFYQWLEELDYDHQETWMAKLKLKRQWLYSIAVLMMVLFMGLYALYLSFKNKVPKGSPLQELWRDFMAKLRDRNLSLSFVSLSESRRVLNDTTIDQKEELLEIWDKLVVESFKNETTHNLEELKSCLKKI